MAYRNTAHHSMLIFSIAIAILALTLGLLDNRAASADGPFGEDDLEGLAMADAGAIGRTVLDTTAVLPATVGDLFSEEETTGLTMADAGAIGRASLDGPEALAALTGSLFSDEELEGLAMADAGAIGGTSLTATAEVASPAP